MKIILDFDDVIVNTTMLKRVAAEFLYGHRGEALPKHALTTEEYTQVQKQVYKGALKNVFVPFPGALEVIRSALRRGHVVVVVTARTGDMKERAESFLRAQQISVPVFGVGYGKSKSMYTIDADILVDDDPKHIAESQAKKKVLFQGGEGIGQETVDSWFDMVKLFELD